MKQTINEKLLIADLTVNGHGTTALIDTGAQRSLMHESVASSNIEPTNVVLKSASGHVLSTLGNCTSTLIFQNEPLEHKLIVVREQHLPAKLILGMDFLLNYECVIRTNPVEMFIGDEQVKLQNIRTYLPSGKLTEAEANFIKDWRSISKNSTDLPKLDNDDDKFKYTCKAAMETTMQQCSTGGITLQLKGNLPFYHKRMSCCFIPNESSNVAKYLQPGVFKVKTESNKPVIHVPYVNFTSKDINVSGKENLGTAELIEIRTIKENIENINTITEEEFDYKSPERLKKIDDEIDKLVSKKRWENLELKALVREYPKVFNLDSDPLSVSPFFAHRIRLKDNEPVYKKAYGIPMKLQPQVDEKIEEMLKNNIISHSRSPYNAPLIPIVKKDSTIRVVLDYRALNEKIVSDTYPMPNISEIFHSLGKSKYFTSLDLRQGYYQLALDEESRPCTAFNTSKGKFEFLVTPMGIKDAPAGFQRAINSVMYGLASVRCFLDDILILGSTKDEHLANLRKVIERLHNAQLSIKISKCRFFETSLKFLGHIISETGLSPDPAKIEAIKKMKQPTTVKEIQGFLGLVGFYRKFIRNFSKIALPLTNLVKGKNIKGARTSPKIHWNDEAEKSFQTLKTILTEEVILKFPDFNKIFEISCDASDFSIGGALHQRDDNGSLRPIMFFSQKLSKAQRNYSTVERECYAIIQSLRAARPIVYGYPIIVTSDHRPLIWVISKTKPTGRLSRWQVELMDYNLTIKFIDGKLNSVADALSRLVYKDEEDGEKAVINYLYSEETNDICLPIAILHNAKEEIQNLVKIDLKNVKNIEIKPLLVFKKEIFDKNVLQDVEGKGDEIKEKKVY